MNEEEMIKMKLFESRRMMTQGPDDGGIIYNVLRVPGGWLLRRYQTSETTFVPEPQRGFSK